MLEPGLGFLLLASAEGPDVAGAVSLAWSRKLVHKPSASDTRCRRRRSNHVISSEAVRCGCEHDCGMLDIGKTDRDSEGPWAFKNGGGATVEPHLYSTVAERPHTGGRARRPLGAALAARLPT